MTRLWRGYRRQNLSSRPLSLCSYTKVHEWKQLGSVSKCWIWGFRVLVTYKKIKPLNSTTFGGFFLRASSKNWTETNMYLYSNCWYEEILKQKHHFFSLQSNPIRITRGKDSDFLKGNQMKPYTISLNSNYEVALRLPLQKCFQKYRHDLHLLSESVRAEAC